MRGPANIAAVEKNAYVTSVGADVRKVIAAIANEYHVINWIKVTTSANIGLRPLSIGFPTISDNAKFEVDVDTAASPVVIRFPRGWYRGVKNEDVQINMNSDNSATVKLTIGYR